MQRIPVDMEDTINSTNDPDTARLVLERTGVVQVYDIPSGGYVGGIDRRGIVVAYITATRITVTPRATDMCIDLPGTNTSYNIEPDGWDVFLGSDQDVPAGTYGVRTDSPRASRGSVSTRNPQGGSDLRRGVVCGGCFVETPSATGVCETCD